MSQTKYIYAGSRALTKPAFNQGAELQTSQGTELSWDERLFPSGEEKEVLFPFKMPGDWKGDSVLFTLRFRTESTVGDALFELYEKKIEVGDDRGALTMAQADTQKTVTVPTTAKEEFEVTFTWIPAGIVGGDLFYLRLIRHGTLPGDTTGDLYLMDFWFQYEDLSSPIYHDEFTDLVDTPLDYTGAADKYVAVKTDETGLEYRTAPGGEANTASNQGAGSQVFKQKTTVDLEFRTLLGAGRATVTQQADTVTVTVPNYGFTDVSDVTKSLSVAEVKHKLVIATGVAGQAFTLPAATSAEDGMTFMIMRNSGNTLSVDVPVTYALVVSGGVTPIIFPDDGDVATFVYRHSNKTYYVV